MATKYERVNPWEEKLKRLYNCSKLIEDDQKYINFQFERYKLRGFHIGTFAFATTFLVGQIPIVKNATPFKYYTTLIAIGVSLYKYLTYLNNRHYEQMLTPYFEKYKVK